MEKAFRPIPLDVLARWVFGDLESRDSVLGIPKANLVATDPRFASRLLGRPLAAPLGVAAGPHSQLAQNIVASWLCGARFIELKTVQVLDELEVSRPCIDSADETFNCEWSQELKLEESFDEYLKAWVLVHALAARLGLPGPGTLFNMSVGYNLEGIRSPRVQHFIASIRDAKDSLPAAVDAVAKVWPGVRDVEIPASISDHITLSTMHGCPPAEIERIARYLLEEVGVHTWVKLNPTLLGPERLRGLLNSTFGFGIEVPDAAFGHDPCLPDALPMVKRLADAARAAGRDFGVKLSNTLEVVNHRPVFPANEKMMYMSGRALHPLTLSLARLFDDELDGQVPISFCGGADAWNFADLVADGVTPITICTDLLKPGGYARLNQYLTNLGAAMDAAGAGSLDAFVEKTSGGRGRRWNLARHAERVVKGGRGSRFARRERPLAFKGSRPLGPFDCIAAPCIEACPAHQNIPDYLWLVAHARNDEAIEVIRRSNALPGVTGSICDHPCTERCVRNLYDTPLGIREIKRFAFENGVSKPEVAAEAKGVKVAIVGAGPAGISAALNLARAGIEAELFEAKGRAGGMVGGAVPRYRLDDDKLKVDLDRLASLGVKTHLNTAVGKDVSLDDLRTRFDYVFLGVGAQKGRKLGIPGEDAEGVVDALEFLDGLREGVKRDLGTRVLVVGGGNSAMDGARSARRLVGDGEVSLVYRRTRAEMPADPAEIHDCEVEGIGLMDLLAPARVVVENGRVVGLACTRMKLGEPDASGRPRPVPLDGSEVVIPADTIVTAIGQETALEFLGGTALDARRDGTVKADLETGETSRERLFAGGDVVRGAASIIKAVADGRTVADEIARRHGLALPLAEPHLPKGTSVAVMMEKKSRLVGPEPVPELPLSDRGDFAEVLLSLDPEAARREAARCLDCDEVCSLCVIVCPNLANQAYSVPPLEIELPSFVVEAGCAVPKGTTKLKIEQGIQIVNIGDACNECGNCVSFCPTSGSPYRDKPTFWIDPLGFAEAKGDAFRMTRVGGTVAIEARIAGRSHRLERRDGVAEYRSDTLRATLDPTTWTVLEAAVVGAPTDGETLDLSTCALLAVLLYAEPALPPLPIPAAGTASL